jgi:hypothetical protein
MIRQLQGPAGPTMLWLWLPGLVGPQGIRVDQASRVTGFDLELVRTRLPGHIEITAADSPLAAAICDKKGQRPVFGDNQPFGPALAARDGQRIGFAEGTRHCLLASKAEGRQIFLGAPFATRQLLAAIQSAAGVHRYDSNFEDVVRGDSLLLVVHSKQGGPREIMLPRPASVSDALSGKFIGEGKRISITLPASTTAIWRLQCEGNQR